MYNISSFSVTCGIWEIMFYEIKLLFRAFIITDLTKRWVYISKLNFPLTTTKSRFLCLFVCWYDTLIFKVQRPILIGLNSTFVLTFYIICVTIFHQTLDKFRIELIAVYQIQMLRTSQTYPPHLRPSSWLIQWTHWHPLPQLNHLHHHQIESIRITVNVWKRKDVCGAQI